MLDKIDRLILDHIQNGFPVEIRPYDAVASELNQNWGLTLSGLEVWERVLRLRKNGCIRRLGAVFNADRLGYKSTLCAAKAPQSQISEFAEMVNAYPQVTHNYLRSDDLNVWFTFSSDRGSALKEFITCLKTNSGIEDIFEMEAVRRFKVRAVFKLRKD
ncbi:MAG: Lrp/AsnC family transcriptional regulator [Candidatus Adiutrix sp.]|jgi:DNA-binding Lrp family transcriptional regulator|nr:Lrp/AsnC family transcriptional regulator [Candidatus Adiutrix sp.]